MGSIGIWQILIVALVVLVLFGRGRISEMMGDFGKGVSSFKKGLNDDDGKEADKPAPRQWQRTFLEALSETSNVSASAKRAHVPPREAYRLRRCDSDFADAWRAALFEGYANLEMEVLGYLRDPAPKHRMDVASALRLLAAHKGTIAGERATRANVSAAEVRASIERKVEIFRRQIVNRREPAADEQ